MTIGEAAEASRLPVKTVRYYGEIGLVPPSGRRLNGYRDYDGSDVARLAFVRRARAFGFSVPECRELLGLYTDRCRASKDVKRIAENRIAGIDRQLEDLARLRDDLERLAEACAGDGRPDCPILSALAAGQG